MLPLAADDSTDLMGEEVEVVVVTDSGELKIIEDDEVVVQFTGVSGKKEFKDRF